MESRVFLGPVADAVHLALDDEWFADEDMNYRMGFGKGFLGVGKAQSTLGDMLSDISYGIYKGTSPIGFVRLSHGSPESRTVKLWMFINPKFRRQGIGSAAMEEVLTKVFTEDISRVEIEALKINEQAVSFLRSFGFTQEGKKEGAHYMHGDAYTVFPFRMLKKHWKKRLRLKAKAS